MRKTLLIAGVCTIAGLTAGLAHAADEADAKAACAAAEEARQAAAELKFEWNTTQPLIAKGMEAVAAGNFDQAVSFCNEAEFQGEAAVAQANAQADLWREAVVK